MFRNVTRFILTKTLKSFLSNYLVNVDVTDIALGGSESGWGLELSNVELKEGAILFSKRRRKKDNSSSKDEDIDETNSLNQDSKVAYNAEENNEVDFDAKSTGEGEDYSSAYTGSDPPTPPSSMSKICYLGFGSSYASQEKNDDEDEKTILQASTHDEDSVHQHPNKDSGLRDKKEDEMEELILKIGKGGGIGELSARMIGNDIYVTIKDANLVLEIFLENEDTTNHGDHDEEEKKKQAKDKKEHSIEEAASGTIDQINSILKSIPYLTMENCILRVNFNSDKHEEDSISHTVMEIGIGFFCISNNFHDFSDNSKRVMNDLITTHSSYLDRSQSDEVTNQNENNIELLQRSVSDTIVQEQLKQQPKRHKIFNIFRKKKDQQIHDEEEDSCIYKHFYTGNTKETGIWIHFMQLENRSIFDERNSSSSMDLWAYYKWKRLTNDCLLKLSNFHLYTMSNIQHHETELESAISNASHKTEYESYDYYNDYTMDTMLFGVDYYSMGAVPPHVHHMHEIEHEDENEDEVEQEEEREENSSYLQSLPTYEQFLNKVNSIIQEEQEKLREKRRKRETPDLIVHFSIHNPIELNLNEYNLNKLGNISKLLLSQDEENEYGNEIHQQNVASLKSWESILVFGVSITSSIVVRLQQLHKTNLSLLYAFGYNEFNIEMLCLDLFLFEDKSLRALDIFAKIQDVHTSTQSGICSQAFLNIIGSIDSPEPNTLGESGNVHSKTDRQVIPTLKEGHSEDNVSAWTCVAASFLEIDEGKYKNLEAVEGVRIEYVHIEESKENVLKVIISSADLDTSFTAISHIQSSIDNALQLVFGTDDKNIDDVDQGMDSASSFDINFQIHFQHPGKIKIQPMINLKFPSLNIQGVFSSLHGIQLSSLMNHCLVDIDLMNALFRKKVQDYSQFVYLPSDIRLRIFLYLDDLSAISEAFHMKDRKKNTKKKNSQSIFQRNSFVRSSTAFQTHALNSKISELFPLATIE